MVKPKTSFLCKLYKRNISVIGVILFAYVIGMLIIYYEILENALILDAIGYSVIISGILGIVILIVAEVADSKCSGFPKSGYEP